MSELEMCTCPRCDGKGTLGMGEYERPCVWCHGEKVIPSHGPAPCFYCRGESGKKRLAFVDGVKNGKRQGWNTWLECDACGGTGYIDAEHYERLLAGQRMYRDRVNRGESIMQAAVRLGLTPAAYSDIERGK